mgnify:CR=1 FL=1
MKQMTLCYLQRDGKYLMLHRTKKKNDINEGKWIGVGGKLEPGETPYECALREIKEETGYRAKSCDFRGIVVFRYNDNLKKCSSIPARTLRGKKLYVMRVTLPGLMKTSYLT